MNLFSRRKHKVPRLLVLGLDCASPDLIFKQWKDDLPNLSRLAAGGTWGELASSIPCITIPAWASMMSSRDPGVLGVYGFRNRADHSYKNMVTADSRAIRVPRLWDVLSAAGKQCVTIGVPQTYPMRPLNGVAVGDFMTPGTQSAFAYPAIAKQDILQHVPDYAFDVKGFRTSHKQALLRRLQEMTEVQFKLNRHLLTTQAWDFFMYVNIGVDRMHHGFWRYHDPAHRLYEAGNPFENAIHDYYVRCDAFIGEMVSLAGDDLVTLVVSDHGVSRMDGGICINEWLIQHGWLTLKTPAPTDGTLLKIEDAEIDWSRTRAWGSGGYYGRVFMNVMGREPEGIIPASDYQTVREELKALIQAIPAPDGSRLSTQVHQPEQIYQQVNGVAPDLMVYFGDLHWRAVGTMGHGSHFTYENDTGPDDANHAVQGMFILHDPRQQAKGQVFGHQLMDIAPTLLECIGQPIPPDMQGRLIG